MELEQLEFDFMKKPVPEKTPRPEKPRAYRVELTRGWDGEAIRWYEMLCTYALAMNQVREMANEDLRVFGPVRDTWTMTEVDEPVKHTVCDYGSHSYFGRIIAHAEK